VPFSYVCLAKHAYVSLQEKEGPNVATPAGTAAASTRSATAARHHCPLDVVSATRASAPREPPLSSPFVPGRRARTVSVLRVTSRHPQKFQKLRPRLRRPQRCPAGTPVHYDRSCTPHGARRGGCTRRRAPATCPPHPQGSAAPVCRRSFPQVKGFSFYIILLKTNIHRALIPPTKRSNGSAVCQPTLTPRK